MKKAMMALILLSGSAAAQERPFPRDGCCIPQNRQALRAETRRGQCLSNTLKRMSCEEVYARFDQSHARINESSLNQFGRLSGPAPAPATVPPPATAPPPPSVPPSAGAAPAVPAATVPAPIITPLPIEPEKAKPDAQPLPK